MKLTRTTTFYQEHQLEEKASWLLFDASKYTLGRLSTRIADVLRGKHKTKFSPNGDTGDYVIVINAKDIHLTGNKLEKKNYYSYSGYMGSLKSTTAGDMLNKKPEYLVEHAVKGMLPKNRLSRVLMTKLKIYAGSEHPHDAQQPVLQDL